MRTVSPAEITKDWRKVVQDAAHEPLRVHIEGLPDIFIVSEKDYEQLRRAAGEKLIKLMDKIGRNAKRRGLTEEKLEELLADES